MAISRVGSVVTTLETGFVTSYTLTLPASPVTGNVLIAILTNAEPGTATPLHTLSGWTPIDEAGNQPTNVSECTIAAWWREVTGSESSTYEITTSGSGAPGITTCIELSGVDTTTPIHQELFSETTGGSVAALTASEVTTTVDDCYCIAAFSIDAGDDFPVSMSGTGWSELVNTSTNTTSNDNGQHVGEKTLSGSGGSADCVSTPTANCEGAWFQIAIAPASATPITIEVLPAGTPY